MKKFMTSGGIRFDSHCRMEYHNESNNEITIIKKDHVGYKWPAKSWIIMGTFIW